MKLSHSLRSLSKTPAFTVAALLTLMLGISAIGSMFAIVHGVLSNLVDGVDAADAASGTTARSSVHFGEFAYSGVGRLKPGARPKPGSPRET